MKIEMGESLFYSWLRHVKECQVVQTNWKVSSQWTLLHEEELITTKEKTDAFFQEKYGYEIYKKNASLAQVNQQGESDAVGVAFTDGITKTYAVDVAFHEAGLNYGSKDVTIMKIINKCIRTAMCLYGFMDVRDAEIIFASPKINKGILTVAEPAIKEAQTILNELGYDVKFRIIANDDFKSMVLDPILIASAGIADTNELFLRSYQMLQMFDDFDEKPEPKKVKQQETYNEIKIGKLAQIMIPRVLQNGKVSDHEFEQMLTAEYSKEVFDLNYPVLVKATEPYDKVRYYTTPIEVGGEQYMLCSQWFETESNNDRPYLEKWIEEHQ
jgi:hypothetical protein